MCSFVCTCSGLLTFFTLPYKAVSKNAPIINMGLFLQFTAKAVVQNFAMLAELYVRSNKTFILKCKTFFVIHAKKYFNT